MQNVGDGSLAVAVSRQKVSRQNRRCWLIDWQDGGGLRSSMHLQEIPEGKVSKNHKIFQLEEKE
jgi:hypothetical protein